MRPNTRQRLATILILAAACLPACRGPGVRDDFDREPEDLTDLIQRVLPAYVFVGGGSGAIISSDGYVITNAHVAGQSKRWRLRRADGTYHSASLVGTSPGTDLCLLKIDAADGLPHLPLGDSDGLRIGDVVIAIGNPFALGNIDGKPTVTLGVVSALHVDRPYAYDAIQTDTPINPGNSGGPLIDTEGTLVGVNAQIMTRFGLRQNTGAGYSISSNQVQRFLPSLKTADGGRVSAGRIAGLGLSGKAADPAVVRAVEPGSEAERAGIKKGDTIFAFERAAVDTVRDFAGALGRYPIGTEVVLRVRRGTGDKTDEHAIRIPISKPGRAYIGIRFTRTSPRSTAIGLIDPKSPAAKAGLKRGDVVLAIAGKRVRSRALYYRVVYSLQPGMTVPVVVRRGRANVTAHLHVAERK